MIITFGLKNSCRSPAFMKRCSPLAFSRLKPTHESHQILEQPNWLSLLAFWCILEGHQPTFNQHLSRECFHMRASSHSIKRCCLHVIKHFVSLSPPHELQISVYYLILRNENIVEHRVEMTLVKTPIVIFLQIFACEMLHWLHSAYLSSSPLMYFPFFPFAATCRRRESSNKSPESASWCASLSRTNRAYFCRYSQWSDFSRKSLKSRRAMPSWRLWNQQKSSGPSRCSTRRWVWVRTTKRRC